MCIYDVNKSHFKLVQNPNSRSWKFIETAESYLDLCSD